MSAGGGKKSLRWLPWLIATPALLAAGWWAATAVHERQSREGWHEPGAAAPPRDAAAVAVTVEPVAARPVQRTVEAVGTLHGYEAVVVSAKVEGRVKRILHDVADRVKPGAALLEIDPTDYEMAERQAEKALQVELAKLGLDRMPEPGFDIAKVPTVVQAKSRLDYAQARLDRAKAVASTSREEMADRTMNYEVAKAEYDNQLLQTRSTQATVRMKQEALAMAKQQRADATVVAPSPTRPVPGDGELTYAITARSVAEGTLVRPGAELFRLVIDRTLKLRAPVPERFARDVQLGQAVAVETAAHPTPFTGTVRRINPAVDPATRTFEVEIEVPNAAAELKSGSFAKANIQTRLDATATTVPLKAVVTFAGITKVFLVENGTAKEVQVTLGVQSTDWVEIRTPTLPAGATVVTSGQTALADGTPVEVRAAK